MREVPLTKGAVAKVDDEDFVCVSAYRWHYIPGRYAVRESGRREPGGRRIIFMHRFILGYDGPLQVDHINGDKLDNRKSNLRLCTHSENIASRIMPPQGTSGYRGVSKSSGKSRPWRSAIWFQGRQVHLGCFASEHDAALAYDRAARRFLGEFARPNLPEQ